MAKAKDPAITEREKQDAFERYPVSKSLAYFIVPTVLSQIAAILLNLADSYFIGRTNDPYQVAAMGLTFPIYVTMTIVAAIMAVGGNANIAAYLGLRDREKAKKFSTFCIYTGLGVVLIFGVLVTSFRTPLLTALGASENTMQFCKDYLFWTVLVGCLPLTFNQTISQLFLSEGEGKVAGFGVSLASILNIFLDPLFIFPLKMGIAGAALATALSRFWLLFLSVVHTAQDHGDLPGRPQLPSTRRRRQGAGSGLPLRTGAAADQHVRPRTQRLCRAARHRPRSRGLGLGAKDNVFPEPDRPRHRPGLPACDLL